MKTFKEEKRKEFEKGYRQITTDVWGYRLIGKRFWVVLDFLWDSISQIIDEAVEKEREEIKKMVNDPTRYTWIDIEGEKLIEEITKDLDTLSKKER